MYVEMHSGAESRPRMDEVMENHMDERKTSRKRTRMVRSYPVNTLEESLAVATTIQEVNAGLPFDRVLLAKAMGTTPASSSFTLKLNSSAKYGLTQGGYNDASIALTQRGEAIVAPRHNGEKQRAVVEAALQPELFTRFYQTLDGRRVPEDTYAKNMLQREFGVHASLSDECLRIIKSNGLYVGILMETGGSLHVSLAVPRTPKRSAVPAVEQLPEIEAAKSPDELPDTGAGEWTYIDSKGRVCILHTGDKDVAEFAARTLGALDIPYTFVESRLDERRPLAAEVSREMRGCTAAILVISRRSDSPDNLNQDILRSRMTDYQIGASSVLYGDRVVALIERGLKHSERPVALRSVEYDKGRLDEAGLDLVQELYRCGAIDVRARFQVDDDEPGV